MPDSKPNLTTPLLIIFLFYLLLGTHQKSLSRFVWSLSSKSDWGKLNIQHLSCFLGSAFLLWFPALYPLQCLISGLQSSTTWLAWTCKRCTPEFMMDYKLPARKYISQRILVKYIHTCDLISLPADLNLPRHARFFHHGRVSLLKVNSD